MDCNTCNDKKTCTSLCEDAEEYASQDYVPPKKAEILVADMKYYDGNPSAWTDNLKENTYLTPMEKKVLALLGQKLNRKDVCQLLGIKSNALDKHISRMKKKFRG